MWFVNTKSSQFNVFLFRTRLLNVGFWRGAEDRALRGRNLSAVFRTLNRQVGKPWKRLPSSYAHDSTVQRFNGLAVLVARFLKATTDDRSPKRWANSDS